MGSSSWPASDAGVDPLARENESPSAPSASLRSSSKFEMTRAEGRALGERATDASAVGGLPRRTYRAPRPRESCAISARPPRRDRWERRARRHAHALVAGQRPARSCRPRTRIRTTSPLRRRMAGARPGGFARAQSVGLPPRARQRRQWTASGCGAGLATVRGGNSRGDQPMERRHDRPLLGPEPFDERFDGLPQVGPNLFGHGAISAPPRCPRAALRPRASRRSCRT